MCVGHAVIEIDKLWQQVSRRGVSEQDEIWRVDRGCLLYIRPRLVNFGPGSPLGAKILKGVKIFCNGFLVHRLSKHDEIWHDKGHLCVAGHLGELWSTCDVTSAPCCSTADADVTGTTVMLCLLVCHS